MDDTTSNPRLILSSNSKANAKIATLCGLLGASVSTASYLLVKGVVAKTLEGVNILLDETCIVTPKDDPTT